MGEHSPDTYLDLDVADFVDSAQDGPANHRRKDVRREIAARIATFDKLRIVFARKNQQKQHQLNIDKKNVVYRWGVWR